MTEALLVLSGDRRCLSLDLEDAGSLLVAREAAPVVTLVEDRTLILTAPAGQGPAGPPGADGFGATLEVLTDVFNQPIGHIAI